MTSLYSKSSLKDVISGAAPGATGDHVDERERHGTARGEVNAIVL
jgi:hypothetical protein